MDPLLPLLRYPVQCWPGADHEQGGRSYLVAGAPSDTETSVDWSRLILRLLCDLRSPSEPHHDEIESSSMDVSD